MISETKTDKILFDDRKDLDHSYMIFHLSFLFSRYYLILLVNICEKNVVLKTIYICINTKKVLL